MANEMELDSDLQRMEWCSLCFKTNSGQLFSLRYLCRHLKIEFRQLFFKCVRKIQVQSEQVGMLDVKMNLEEAEVNLCSECGERVKKFSDLFKQMEKIQLEMEWYLEVIRKLVGESDKEKERFKVLKNDGNINSLVWMEMVGQLRKSILFGIPHSKSKPGIKLKRCNWRGNGGVSTSKYQDRSGTLSLDLRDLSMVKKEVCPESGDWGLDSEASSDVASTPQQPVIEEGLSNVNDDFGSQELDDKDNHPEEEDSDGSWRQSNEDNDVCSEDSDPASPATEPNSEEPQKGRGFHRHFKNVHLSKRIQCHLCTKRFNRSDLFQRHLRNIHDPKAKEAAAPVIEYKCDIGECTFTCKIKNRFTNHQKLCKGIMKVPKILNFKCSTCGSGWASAKLLRRHEKRVHSDTAYKCDECGKAFTVRGNLKTHIERIHLKIRYNCDHIGCKKSYADKHLLMLHKITCEKPPPVLLAQPESEETEALEEMKIEESQDLDYTMDEANEHCVKLSKNKYQCKICNFVVKNTERYRNHFKRIHVKTRAFACSQCPKKFARGGDLNVHLRHVHADGELFRCDKGECQYTTKTATYFKTHQRGCEGLLNPRHLKDSRDYMCSDCGKRFRSTDNLKAHQRMIHGGKKFVCEQCGKVFKTKEYLWAHNRVEHVGLRYSCDSPGCGKQYRSSSNLKLHKSVCGIKLSDNDK